ncbi:MAG: tail fiber protein, partial [Desulfovibrio sp.]|nr:tail fiber protein [Desulfovibrio sp.]
MALLALPVGVRAVAICDSTDGDCGLNGISTAQSHDVSMAAAAAYKDPSTNIPIATIIVWYHKNMLAEEKDKWLECDGQAVNASLYPELYALMHNTPNLTGRFLRAGLTAELGLTFEDSIKTHRVVVDAHEHTISGDGKTTGT